jgi:hypothetical protein
VFRQCGDLLREIVTEFGTCCTFNLIPDLTGPRMGADSLAWAPESGYEASLKRDVYEIPYRTGVDFINISFGRNVFAQMCIL